MERIEEDARSISPVVAQYPHQGCERLWSIARGTNSACIGRRQRLERIPKTFPELVDLSESLDLEQSPDARVLGVLSAGLKEPAIHLLPCLSTRRHDLVKIGMRMVYDILNEPQLQGMNMGDVATIMQVKTLRCVLRIELCDVCIRKRWRLKMDT